MEDEAKKKAEAEAAAKKAAEDEAARKAAEETAKSTDVEYLRGELRKVIEQRDKAKGRLRDAEAAEAELKKLRESQMSDLEKAQARIRELEPLEARVKSLQEVVERMVETELSDLPDDAKRVVPDVEPVKKLDWLREARKTGLFKPFEKKKSIGSSAPGTPEGVETIKTSEMAALANTDFAVWRQKRKLIEEGKLAVLPG